MVTLTLEIPNDKVADIVSWMQHYESVHWKNIVTEHSDWTELQIAKEVLIRIIKSGVRKDKYSQAASAIDIAEDDEIVA